MTFTAQMLGNGISVRRPAGMMAQMCTYHSARLIMPVSCHFLRVGICRFHKTGIGKATIRASSTALMMATEMT